MIVRPADGVRHLITQPDHAALAGRIMARWSSLAEADRREAILHAVAAHDDGWREPDAAPTCDPATGAIRDFVGVPTAVKQAVWPRALAGLADAPWTAALVAHHALSVYDRFRPDPEWAAFFAGMEAARDRLVVASGLPIEALVRDYVYVRLGDLASLAFCNAWTEPQVLGPWTMRLLDTCHLLVEPNPFVHDVPIAVDARVLPLTRWPDDAQLQAAWHDAPTVTLTGLVVGRTRTS